MNRKNTILIAVFVNVSLLAILLMAALTMQEEPAPSSPVLAEAPVLPRFDEPLLPLPVLKEEIVLADPIKIIEPAQELEPVVHNLPPLAMSEPPLVSVVTSALREVTVKKGDTLDKIAKAHQTTVDAMIKLNHLTNTLLKVGQVLKLPLEKVVTKVEKKSLPANPEYYTIKVGDSPWAIAKKHSMKVEELLRLNGLNEERARKLKAGDRLRIR